MFSESKWSRKAIGDVDVVYHDGLYHLFHLVLPNHDFIAHAISEDAISWRRVDNALFIGDPGNWDDLMLWTMHVTRDPYREGSWRMFYTGLSRKDQGLTQRLGMAVSDDLYRWQKSTVNWKDTRGPNDPERVKQAVKSLDHGERTRIKQTFDAESAFPLVADEKYYEASLDGERQWISFRDPFYYRDDGDGYLLMAAREKDGPIVRRGCIGAMKEVSPNQFEARPPLHAPGLYDDIEVPNLIRLEDEYYLIGSIREDAKIRYWHAEKIGDSWKNYHDNVLLPKGNYAGRTCRDPHGVLLWNFYTDDLSDRTVNNLMPPPKRLHRSPNGQLRVTTFEALNERTGEELDTRCVRTLKADRPQHFCRLGNTSLDLVSEAGFQAYVFDPTVESFRMRGKLNMHGTGKCGLLYRINPDTHDGYYISLDLYKGIAQFRSWGTGPAKSGENMMQFQSKQAGFWYSESRHEIDIQLIAFGSYHELSIDGGVVLSLADSTFDAGLLGIYIETANLTAHNLTVERLDPPLQSDEHLASG